MRAINAEALEKDGWRMIRNVQIDKETMEFQTRKPTDFPTIEPERKKGEWTEKTVIENPQAAGIDEWQSCKCSNCGRYDTRPYKYYFNEPRYCSYCGAEMRGEKDG